MIRRVVIRVDDGEKDDDTEGFGRGCAISRCSGAHDAAHATAHGAPRACRPPGTGQDKICLDGRSVKADLPPSRSPPDPDHDP